MQLREYTRIKGMKFHQDDKVYLRNNKSIGYHYPNIFIHQPTRHLNQILSQHTIISILVHLHCKLTHSGSLISQHHKYIHLISYKRKLVKVINHQSRMSPVTKFTHNQ